METLDAQPDGGDPLADPLLEDSDDELLPAPNASAVPSPSAAEDDGLLDDSVAPSDSLDELHDENLDELPPPQQQGGELLDEGDDLLDDSDDLLDDGSALNDLLDGDGTVPGVSGTPKAPVIDASHRLNRPRPIRATANRISNSSRRFPQKIGDSAVGSRPQADNRPIRMPASFR